MGPLLSGPPWDPAGLCPALPYAPLGSPWALMYVLNLPLAKLAILLFLRRLCRQHSGDSKQNPGPALQEVARNRTRARVYHAV